MQTDDGPIIKRPVDKIKAFHLIEIVPSLLPWIKEQCPLVFDNNDISMWKYIKFHFGEIYFYSEAYIQSNELYEIESDFLHMLFQIQEKTHEHE